MEAIPLESALTFRSQQALPEPGFALLKRLCSESENFRLGIRLPEFGSQFLGSGPLLIPARSVSSLGLGAARTGTEGEVREVEFWQFALRPASGNTLEESSEAGSAPPRRRGCPPWRSFKSGSGAWFLGKEGSPQRILWTFAGGQPQFLQLLPIGLFSFDS